MWITKKQIHKMLPLVSCQDEDWEVVSRAEAETTFFNIWHFAQWNMNYEHTFCKNLNSIRKKIIKQREIYWGNGNSSGCLNYKAALGKSQSSLLEEWTGGLCVTRAEKSMGRTRENHSLALSAKIIGMPTSDKLLFYVLKAQQGKVLAAVKVMFHGWASDQK